MRNHCLVSSTKILIVKHSLKGKYCATLVLRAGAMCGSVARVAAAKFSNRSSGYGISSLLAISFGIVLEKTHSYLKVPST